MRKKSIMAFLLATVIAMPCILIFDGGPQAPNGDETLGWTNIVGFAWFGFLALGGFNAISPKWMKDELKAYMGE